jgi:hypothetical protein
MKSIVRLLVVIAIVAAIGFWAWSYFFPNPEKIIRSRLNTVAKLASFAAGEGNISRVANVQKLGLYFTEEVEVNVNVPGMESHNFTRREELTQAAMAAKGAVTSIKAEFLDINVDVAKDKQTATADLTLRVNVGGEKDSIVQQLKIHLNNVKGEWLIHRIDTVQTLK